MVANFSMLKHCDLFFALSRDEPGAVTFTGAAVQVQIAGDFGV